MTRRSSLAALILLTLSACSEEKAPTASKSPSPQATSSAAALNATWQPCAKAPSSRQEVAAAAVGDEIFVAGGLDADGHNMSTVEVYNTKTNTWRALPDLPINVDHAMATSWRGTFVVLGGQGSDTESAQVFAFRNGVWTKLPTLGGGRVAGAAVTVGDQIVVAGGDVEAIEIFDGTSWRKGPPLRNVLNHVGGATDGRLVYLAGGRRAGGHFAEFKSIDPASGAVVELPKLPTARSGLGAAFVNGYIVTAGGEGGRIFPEVEAYDVAAKAWRRLPNMGEPRHGVGVVAVGSTVYALHGGSRVGLGPSASCEQLDLSELKAR